MSKARARKLLKEFAAYRVPTPRAICAAMLQFAAGKAPKPGPAADVARAFSRAVDLIDSDPAMFPQPPDLFDRPAPSPGA